MFGKIWISSACVLLMSSVAWAQSVENTEDRINTQAAGVASETEEKLFDAVTSERNAITTQDDKLSDQEMALIEAALSEDAEEVENRKIGSSTSFVSAVQSMNPDMSLSLNVAAAIFGKEKNYQTGGHDPTENGFNLQQVEMTLGASVDPYFRFDANLVFSLFGVEIEEAYATTLALPFNLQARAGQFLTRFGRINNTHPHQWEFIDQPVVIGKFFGSEANRGLGAELSYLAHLPWYLEIVGSTLMSGGGSTNRSTVGDSGLKVKGFNHLLYTAAIKQFFPVSDKVGIYWGLSAQFGANGTGFGNRTDLYGSDLYIKYKPSVDYPQMFFALQAEALFRLRQVPGELRFDAGYYAQLVWQVNREWQTGFRSEFVTGKKGDDLDPAHTKNRDRYSLLLSYAPSHFSKIRMQASVDNPRWEDKPIFAGFISLEVMIGTHGAHTY